MAETSETRPPTDVATELSFFVPDGARPRVLMSAAYTGENRRSGTFRDEPVTIHDARRAQPPPRLEREGFELVDFASDCADFYDAAEVEARHYPEIEAFLKAHTGAGHVHIFDHTLRVQDDAVREANDTRGPVLTVHNDYTETSGPRRVRDLLEPDLAAKFLAGRFALVNVWRSIGESAERLPLAIADARTMRMDDFVATDLVYEDRTGEIYQIAHSAGQRWSYFQGLEPHEAVLLKCFDSATDGRARYTAHGAFEHPNAQPGTPPRASIEVRTLLGFV